MMSIKKLGNKFPDKNITFNIYMSVKAEENKYHFKIKYFVDRKNNFLH